MRKASRVTPACLAAKNVKPRFCAGAAQAAPQRCKSRRGNPGGALRLSWCFIGMEVASYDPAPGCLVVASDTAVGAVQAPGGSQGFSRQDERCMPVRRRGSMREFRIGRMSHD